METPAHCGMVGGGRKPVPGSMSAAIETPMARRVACRLGDLGFEDAVYRLQRRRRVGGITLATAAGSTWPSSCMSTNETPLTSTSTPATTPKSAPPSSNQEPRRPPVDSGAGVSRAIRLVSSWPTSGESRERLTSNRFADLGARERSVREQHRQNLPLQRGQMHGDAVHARSVTIRRKLF